MLRCINHLETISNGHLTVNDISVGDKKTDINKLRRNIGMVFQHFYLYPHKTVLRKYHACTYESIGTIVEEAKKTAIYYLR